MLILSDRVTSWCHFAVAVFAPVAPASEKNLLTFQNHLKKKDWFTQCPSRHNGSQCSRPRSEKGQTATATVPDKLFLSRDTIKAEEVRWILPCLWRNLRIRCSPLFPQVKVKEISA